jgi:hypothetical protein
MKPYKLLLFFLSSSIFFTSALAFQESDIQGKIWTNGGKSLLANISGPTHINTIASLPCFKEGDYYKLSIKGAGPSDSSPTASYRDKGNSIFCWFKSENLLTCLSDENCDSDISLLYDPVTHSIKYSDPDLPTSSNTYYEKGYNPNESAYWR